MAELSHSYCVVQELTITLLNSPEERAIECFLLTPLNGIFILHFVVHCASVHIKCRLEREISLEKMYHSVHSIVQIVVTTATHSLTDLLYVQFNAITGSLHGS